MGKLYTKDTIKINYISVVGSDAVVLILSKSGIHHIHYSTWSNPFNSFSLSRIDVCLYKYWIVVESFVEQ